MNARAVALAALEEWRRRRNFADTILQSLLAGSALQAADRAFATELFYGVLRNLSLLDFWINRLRSSALDHSSRDLLRLGLYQIFLLQTPEHAAVFETVALSGRRNRALINGVLRSALRGKDELVAAGEDASPAIRFSHPEFLLERWREALSTDAMTALCRWNNEPAPIYARVNQLRISPNEFKQVPIADRENFFQLTEIPAEALRRGDCYIQDPSTAVACDLLAPQPNETILDACAAPGGKSAYLSELMQNTGTLIACDREPARINRLRENLERLGLTNAAIVRHNWSDQSLPGELRTRQFDRILVDAPCSNTGVMRRRVDVRWRLRPDDFARMQKEQLLILRAVLPLLKLSGVLVYSTCSLESDENEQVVRRLLEEFPGLHLEEQKSVLPWCDHFDGAFAARLVRLS